MCCADADDIITEGCYLESCSIGRAIDTVDPGQAFEFVLSGCYGGEER